MSSPFGLTDSEIILLSHSRVFLFEITDVSPEKASAVLETSTVVSALDAPSEKAG